VLLHGFDQGRSNVQFLHVNASEVIIRDSAVGPVSFLKTAHAANISVVNVSASYVLLSTGAALFGCRVHLSKLHVQVILFRGNIVDSDVTIRDCVINVLQSYSAIEAVYVFRRTQLLVEGNRVLYQHSARSLGATFAYLSKLEDATAVTLRNNTVTTRSDGAAVAVYVISHLRGNSTFVVRNNTMTFRPFAIAGNKLLSQVAVQFGPAAEWWSQADGTSVELSGNVVSMSSSGYDGPSTATAFKWTRPTAAAGAIVVRGNHIVIDAHLAWSADGHRGVDVYPGGTAVVEGNVFNISAGGNATVISSRAAGAGAALLLVRENNVTVRGGAAVWVDGAAAIVVAGNRVTSLSRAAKYPSIKCHASAAGSVAFRSNVVDHTGALGVVISDSGSGTPGSAAVEANDVTVRVTGTVGYAVSITTAPRVATVSGNRLRVEEADGAALCVAFMWNVAAADACDACETARNDVAVTCANAWLASFIQMRNNVTVRANAYTGRRAAFAVTRTVRASAALTLTVEDNAVVFAPNADGYHDGSTAWVLADGGGASPLSLLFRRNAFRLPGGDAARALRGAAPLFRLSHLGASAGLLNVTLAGNTFAPTGAVVLTYGDATPTAAGGPPAEVALRCNRWASGGDNVRPSLAVRRWAAVAEVLCSRTTSRTPAASATGSLPPTRSASGSSSAAPSASESSSLSLPPASGSPSVPSTSSQSASPSRNTRSRPASPSVAASGTGSGGTPSHSSRASRSAGSRSASASAAVSATASVTASGSIEPPVLTFSSQPPFPFAALTDGGVTTRTATVAIVSGGQDFALGLRSCRTTTEVTLLRREGAAPPAAEPTADEVGDEQLRALLARAALVLAYVGPRAAALSLPVLVRPPNATALVLRGSALRVRVTFPASCFSLGVFGFEGSNATTVAVAPVPRREPLRVVPAAVEAAGTAAVLVSAFAGSPGTAAAVSRTNLVGALVECNALDGGALPFASSPTGVALTDEASVQYRVGALVFNTLLLAGLGLLVVAAAGARYAYLQASPPGQAAAGTFAACRAWARFPSLLAFPLLFLLQPTAAAALVCAAHAAGAAAQAVGVLGVAGAAAVAEVLRRLLFAHFRGAFVPHPAEEPVAVTGCGTLAARVALVFRSYGEWCDTTANAAPFVRRFLLFFADYNGGARWFYLVEVGVCVLMGAVEATMNIDNCTVSRWLLLLLMAAYVAAIAYWRPHESLLNALCSGAIGVLQLLAALLALIYGATSADVVVEMMEVLLAMAMAVAVVKGVYDMVRTAVALARDRTAEAERERWLAHRDEAVRMLQEEGDLLVTATATYRVERAPSAPAAVAGKAAVGKPSAGKAAADAAPQEMLTLRDRQRRAAFELLYEEGDIVIAAPPPPAPRPQLVHVSVPRKKNDLTVTEVDAL
jgi:hypothetical protein